VVEDGEKLEEPVVAGHVVEIVVSRGAPEGEWDDVGEGERQSISTVKLDEEIDDDDVVDGSRERMRIY
jgi:hypothetical protein